MSGINLLNPSTGLADDQDVTIKSIRAVVGTDKDDATKQWPSLTMTMVLDNGKEAQEYYSAGSLERIRPSPDGLELLPNVEGASLSDQTNAWKLISSLVNAVRGFTDVKVGEAFMAKWQAAPNLLSHFDGATVHINRHNKPKRDDAKEGDRTKTIVLVSAIRSFPGGKPAAKGTKPVVAKPVATPTASATTDAPAATPVVVEGDMADVVKGIILTALGRGPIARNKIATEVFTVVKANQGDWKAAMALANDETFIKGLVDEPHDVAGDGKLVVLEYDGATLKIAA